MDLTSVKSFDFGREGMILQLIPKAMELINEIPKRRKRQAGGDGGGSFNFRGIDDALNYISPVLSHLGITPVTQLLDINHETVNVTDKNGKPKVMNRSQLVLAVQLIAQDGSWVRHVCGGMATDYNDGTSSNKAHSAAEKYCLFLGLMVPVDRVALEDQDDDENQGDEENAPSSAYKADDAIRGVERPGDNKAEELTQIALTAIQDAYANKNQAKIKTVMEGARNSAKLNEEQRNTILASGKQLLAKLIAETPPAESARHPNQQGQQDKSGSQPAKKPAAGSPPPAGQKNPAAKTTTQKPATNPSTNQGVKK